MFAKGVFLKIQMNIYRHCFARASLEKPISKHAELNRKKTFLDQALHSLFVHNAFFSLLKKVTEQTKLGTQQSAVHRQYLY